MDYKQLLLGVGIIGLIAFGAYVYFQPSAEENMYGSSGERVEEMDDGDREAVEETESTETGMLVPGVEGADEMVVENDSGDTTSDTQTYTLAEVAAHASEDSCWTAVEGKVYDLTPALDSHPGGKKNIMKICGIDGTAAFTGKHGESDKAKAAIATRYIGELAQ